HGDQLVERLARVHADVHRELPGVEPLLVGDLRRPLPRRADEGRAGAGLPGSPWRALGVPAAARRRRTGARRALIMSGHHLPRSSEGRPPRPDGPRGSLPPLYRREGRNNPLSAPARIPTPP